MVLSGILWIEDKTNNKIKALIAGKIVKVIMEFIKN
jgi:hypothetical protein